VISVRAATAADVPAITEIYNEAILTTDATFDSEPKSVASQEQWFAGHDARHPILVAERDGKVVGWASLSAWSDRCAYADTAEISVYLKSEHRGQGIGTVLMTVIMQRGAEAGLHSVIARITEGNEASVRLHCRAGFEDIGVMREVGVKFGRLLDVRMMQRIYR